MTETFKIKPAPGLTVRDPVTTQPLAAKGETKPRNSHWLRRLSDGDVVVVTNTASDNKESKQ